MKYCNFMDFYATLGKENDEANAKWEEMSEKDNLTNKISNIVMFIVDLPILIVIAICVTHYKIQFQSLYITLLGVFVMIFIDFFIALMTEILVGSKNVAEFNEEYKQSVINKMLENFVEDLDYVPQKGMPQKIYNESGYEDYHNEYKSDDYFEGVLCGLKIRMADVTTELVTIERDKDGNTSTETDLLFSGLFGKVKLNKSINMDMRITNDKGLFSKGKHKVEMDAQDFEKVFNVYATNSIVAMQILTIDIQEDIINLYNESKIDFDIIIKDDNMYIFFHTGDMFEVYSMKNKPREILEEYVEIMKFITELVDKMTKTIDKVQL